MALRHERAALDAGPPAPRYWDSYARSQSDSHPLTGAEPLGGMGRMTSHPSAGGMSYNWGMKNEREGQPYRQVRLGDNGVTVEHEGADWHSEAEIDATWEQTTVRIGDVVLEVGGTMNGCRARLSCRGQELWAGCYLGEPVDA